MKKGNQIIRNLVEYPKIKLLVLPLILTIIPHLLKYLNVIRPGEEMSLKDWSISILAALIVGITSMRFEKWKKSKVNNSKV